MSKKKRYACWVDQVNQVRIEVSADNVEEAREKAYRKWRREWADGRVTYIEEVES